MATVTTTKGDMDESLLEKRTGWGWVEYWLDGELVHRSASVSLSGVFGLGTAADFGSGTPAAATPATFDAHGQTWTIKP